MTKNVTVFDSEGKLIGMTYPRRAAGLVKNGRAQYRDGAETAIILARSPDIIINDTSQEDEVNMSNFNFEEYREKIEAMLRTAAEKMDAVSKTAADMIDDTISRIKNGEEKCSIEFTEDENGDVNGVSVTVGDEVPTEEEREQFAEVADEAAEEARAESERRREAFTKLVADAKEAMRAAAAEASKYTEAAKEAVSNAAAGASKYAGAAKEKIGEKITEYKEARAEKAAQSESEQKFDKAYYLGKIAELSADTEHINNTMQSVIELVQNMDENTEGDIANAIDSIVGVAAYREEINRKTMEFYIRQVEMLDAKLDEAVNLARADAERNNETPVERRARLIANDATRQNLLREAASNLENPGDALAVAEHFIQNYIKTVYGDFSTDQN